MIRNSGEQKCLNCGKPFIYIDKQLDIPLKCCCGNEIKTVVRQYEHYPINTSVYVALNYDSCPKCGYNGEIVKGVIKEVYITIEEHGEIKYDYSVSLEENKHNFEYIAIDHNDDAFKIFDTYEQAKMSLRKKIPIKS